MHEVDLDEEVIRWPQHPSGIGRERDRKLVDALLRAVAQNDGKLTPAVAKQAMEEVHARNYTPETALEFIHRKLSNPNIRKAIGNLFESYAEFPLEDALKMHVRHIKGEQPKGASYQALKDYEAMTIPIPAKKVEVGVGVFNFGQHMAGDVPPVAARAIGPAIVGEAVQDAVVVELEGEDGDDES